MHDHRPPLRILCYGAGAIGTYIGGSLALAGNQVVFLERPELGPVLLEQGLRLDIQGHVKTINKPEVIDSITRIPDFEAFDVAIFALKSYDTQPAINEMRPVSESIPPVLCLQNGIENESLLRALLGPERVIAGTVTSSVGRNGLGDIVLEKQRGVGISSEHHLSGRLVEEFNRSGLVAQSYRNADNMKWSKMLTNLITNASSAILDMTPGEILENPALYELEIRQLKEALDVMKRQSLNVTNLPGTPVKMLAFAASYLPLSVSRPFLMRAAGTGRGGKMPSFHIDLYSGKGKSEVTYLNGVVTKTGEKLQIRTPVNSVFTRILEGLSTGEYPMNEFKHQPGKLIAQVNAFQ